MKIGDYVRIKWGNGEQTISKCKDINDIGDTPYSKNDYYIHTDVEGEVIYKTMIIKSSPNIIDLIEVGDYVNTYKVSFVNEEPVMGKFVQCDYEVSFGTTNHYRFYEADIKSIVTREQFSQIEYRIGD